MKGCDSFVHRCCEKAYECFQGFLVLKIRTLKKSTPALVILVFHSWKLLFSCHDFLHYLSYLVLPSKTGLFSIFEEVIKVIKIRKHGFQNIYNSKNKDIQKNVVHTVEKLIKTTFQRYATHSYTAKSRNDEKCIQSVVQILVNWFFLKKACSSTRSQSMSPPV